MPELLIVLLAVTAGVWVLASLQLIERGFLTRSRIAVGICIGVAVVGSLHVLTLRSDVGSLISPGTVSAAASVILMLAFVVSGFAPQERRSSVHLRITATIVAYSLVALWFTFNSTSGAGQTENLLKVASIAFVPLFVMLLSGCRISTNGAVDVVYFVSGLVVLASIVLAFFVPSVAFGLGAASDIRRYAMFGLEFRLSGVTPHPNFLGLVAVLFIALGLFRGRQIVVNLAVGLVCLGLAESRMAFIATAAVVMVYVSWRLNLLRGPIVSSIGVLVFVLIAFTDETFLLADVQADGRARVWSAVLEQLTSNPMAGWGILAFVPESGSPYEQVGLLHAHNQFLQAVVEGGILGLFLMVSFTAQLGFLAWRALKESPVPLAVFSIWLVASMTEPVMSAHLYGFGFPFVIPFIILIVLNAGRVHVKSPEARRGIRRPFAG